MRRLLAVAAALFLAFPAAASARPLLGVHGAVDRFDQLTGQRSQIRHLFFGWGNTRFDQNFPAGGPTPMIAMIPATISPLAIARGSGDAYLFALNDWLARRGGNAYVRPMPEMNGHWNAYCAYTKSGRSKGAAYSTVAFRKAFARIAVLVRGGSSASMNTQLARLKLPLVSRDLAARAAVRIVWNPQGYGSPDLPGNSAQAYYPGDRYVDVVANDLYYIRGKAAWDGRRAVVRRAPVEALRVRRVGSVGTRCAELRRTDGAASCARIAASSSWRTSAASAARHGTSPRSPQPRGVQAADRPARRLAGSLNRCDRRPRSGRL
jgi:hypothetical protein